MGYRHAFDFFSDSRRCLLIMIENAEPIGESAQRAIERIFFKNRNQRPQNVIGDSERRTDRPSVRPTPPDPVNLQIMA